MLGASSLGAQQPTPPPRPVPAPTRPDTVRDSVKVVLPAPTRPDSTRIDSVRGIPDTLKTKVRPDSIQAPIARTPMPRPVDVRAPYRWTRDSVYSTGAVTLTDLLERVPGVTVFRSGFLASAQTAAYHGDVARVRVFRDGIELDGIDPRNGGIPDLADIQLANIDEIAIEPAAGEIRVHVRTWTVRNTTPYTRVDASTGDEDTNLYRFFYGKRFGNGLAAQLGVQQFGTGARNRRIGGGGSVLDVLGRLGWARGAWSVDLTGARLDRERDLTFNTFTDQDSILGPFKGRRNDATLRVGYRDPEAEGLWVQALATSASLRLTGTGFQRIDTVSVARGIRIDTTLIGAIRRIDTTGTVTGATVDTVAVPDSSGLRHQYLLTGGYNLGALRVSGGGRLRRFRDATYGTPFARADYRSSLFSVSGYFEANDVEGLDVVAVPTKRKGFADTTRAQGVAGTAGIVVPPARSSHFDVAGQVTPFGWLSFSGGFSRVSTTQYGYAVDSTDVRRDTILVRDPGTTTLRRVVRDTAIVPRLVSVPTDAVTTARAEALVRVGRMWLGMGRLQRSAAFLLPPLVYGQQTVMDTVRDASVGATIASARGPVWKDVYADVTGTAWDRGGWYRPQYQLRGEVGVSTMWLSRFPSGNFGFKFALIDNYRSRTLFPSASSDSGAVLAGASNTLDVQLEIRILRGVVNYQLRNALNRQYELVPGFRMPGPINFYGLRWEFWN